MNTAKLTILKDTFEKQFDLGRFKKFTREFFNEPEVLLESRRTGIWKEYLNHINLYYTIAKYTDSEDNNLIVLAVELKKDSSIDRARSMQRNFISKILDANNMEAAIVAFYTENDPSWRLSFVRLDYSFKETGIALDLTPARRYSYLLGENEPNNTAQAQLLPIFEDDRHNPTLDEIENAFSVEKVTKDFFSLYEDKYFSLKEYLENDSAFIAETLKLGFEVEKFSEQFAKKLMGQLAFLYFLQKKGWLGVRIMPENHTLTEADFQKIYTVQDQAHRNVLDKVFKMAKDKSKKLSPKELFSIDDHEAALLSDCFMGTAYDMPWGSGNRTFIREIFDFCINHTTKNFFDDYLEPFFYEALNTKRNNQYFKRFNCKIPFLNGGLFEPLEGYHWKDVDFEIPNELFSNKAQKGREADGILDIFDRFNFTINEDEPLEKEVAVDPEMLGKIFENLLDVSDRKSKGAFYTPREIVHYMCQESLINYLVNEVGVPYEDMKEFILYGELIRDADNRINVGYSRDFAIKQSIYDNIDKIDDALKNVKVADPAVGSGAFPLGMLNEIVKARNNITEYIIRKDKEGFFDRKFGDIFIRKRRAPYKMKWDTIKNSIFAVDIEPSAVDIAKLRLWLSVVVEQEINAENSEPHPLPNLDMNIQVGNSLIDEYEGIKLFDKSILSKKNDEVKENEACTTSETIQMSLIIDHTDEMLREMFALQDRYFDEDNEERKKDIKAKIDHIRDELIRYKLQRDNNDDALKRYTESFKNKTKPYFIWEMEFAKIFKNKGGFDIIIGNPPYVNIYKIPQEQKDYFYNGSYQSANKKFDLYILFMEKTFMILKNNGISCLITSNKWLSQAYGQNIREIYLERNLSKIINLNFNVFDATVDTAITFAENILNHKKDVRVLNLYQRNFNPTTITTQSLLNQLSAIMLDENSYINIPKEYFTNNEESKFRLNLTKDKLVLLDKIKNNSKRLDQYCYIAYGLRGNAPSLKQGKDYFVRSDNPAGKYVPYFEGKMIDRWRFSSELFFDYKPKLHYNSMFREMFNAEKLVSNEIVGKGKFKIAYDSDGRFNSHTVINIVKYDLICNAEYKPLKKLLKNQELINNAREINYFYLLGILNSKLIYWYFNELLAIELHFYPNYVKELPIKNYDPIIGEQIISCVSEIMNSGNNRLSVSALEGKLDELIFKLYDLHDEEVNIIEESIKIKEG